MTTPYAIAAKIKAQAEYVCWRDGKATPSQKSGGPGRGKRVAVPGPVLPDADPGKQVAERWRKSFCQKGETGTVIDQMPIADAARLTHAMDRPAGIRQPRLRADAPATARGATNIAVVSRMPLDHREGTPR